MHHFGFLGKTQVKRLFHQPPVEISIDAPAHLLAAGLGATLYCPGDRPKIAKDVVKQAARGCVSMVLCLEDSIADSAVDAAEINVAEALQALHRISQDKPETELPLLFVRVRTPEQILRVAELAGDGLEVLSGFVVPKFENLTGYAEGFFGALREVQRHTGFDGAGDKRRLRLMPILESPVMIHRETRGAALASIREILHGNRDDVLAVRIGATDLASAFGLRRSRDLTVYDVQVVASVISDIVNVLGRHEDSFVTTGTVWEHYASERILRPQLRLTPFVEANETDLRRKLLGGGLDGLIREIALDQANGLLGKTVIHPSHVPVVHAMSVVSHEEFLDATAILDNVGGGASASPYGNKMNEVKPHSAWAEKTMVRAEAFGVASESTTFVDFLEASMR
ncbi:citrate lyase beta subunit [Glaciihabitans tibetensis]|uniref:Citrate lyase beta subunit n=1 Tax=Glaciihabitans tibetensis TaxID=1266600 RepID=A0A2T0VAB7_9MICO|nr:HpcH/HpaI aldolase/citrate lyase family protein [Glaciihabitans tibetensis]PRY67146.1 citrate lyase beta subunit [Glaciihabitans tibetensis]